MSATISGLWRISDNDLLTYQQSKASTITPSGALTLGDRSHLVLCLTWSNFSETGQSIIESCIKSYCHMYQWYQYQYYEITKWSCYTIINNDILHISHILHFAALTRQQKWVCSKPYLQRMLSVSWYYLILMEWSYKTTLKQYKNCMLPTLPATTCFSNNARCHCGCGYKWSDSFYNYNYGYIKISYSAPYKMHGST